MIALAREGYFVTGSDTDVGKTYIARQLVAQLRGHGDVETRKPAESGCAPGPDGALLARDAAELRDANGRREPLERIAPFRFRAALAPHRAARLEGSRLTLEQLVDACKRTQSTSRLLVEGAGGFLSPLAENGLNADLASALQLPVIVVVDDRVGAVNQALMSAEAVAARHLGVAAIVLNQVEPGRIAGMDNAADLRAWCDCPVFECGYRGSLPALFAS